MCMIAGECSMCNKKMATTILSEIASRKRKMGFTLVELLVVIAIIALLLAMLMPALGRVRNQARMVTCMANIKQVGTLVQCYMADNNGRAPLLTALGAYTSVPAEKASLALALRKYTGGTSSLPATMNPEVSWTIGSGLMQEYAAKYMPAYFQCPLIRKQAVKASLPGTVVLGKKRFFTAAYRGAQESYGYPLFDGIYAGYPMYPNHPLGYPNGYFKYSMLTWYDPTSASYGQILDDWDSIKGQIRPNQWDQHAKKLGSSLSQSVVLTCMQGEWYGFMDYIMNYNSHMKGKQGGCPVLMGDMHVDWVPGTQIGWF